jgi:hypothetical protein
MVSHGKDEDDGDLPLKLKWLDNFIGRWGVPTVLLLTFATFFFGGLYWLAKEIAKPLVAQHVKFLDQEITTSQGVLATQKTIADAVQKMIENRDKLSANSARQIEILDTMQAQMRTDHTQQAVDHKAACGKLEEIERKLKIP